MKAPDAMQIEKYLATGRTDFEIKDLLQAASLKRNGWKEILRQCSHAPLSA
ncbi:hypothetical protein JST97_06645 [bacterium]|nr:hypothetical protein [bacterium]